MALPFSLFSISILIATISIILLMTELIADEKGDYGIKGKRLRSVGILFGVIYLFLFFARLFFLT